MLLISSMLCMLHLVYVCTIHTTYIYIYRILPYIYYLHSPSIYTYSANEVPVFWACGVTPQNVIMNSKPSVCITHSPGCMLILDIKNDSLSL